VYSGLSPGVVAEAEPDPTERITKRIATARDLRVVIKLDLPLSSLGALP
jgi:hypothetical protein